MNQLFSQRLKLARTRAGCSQDKLVEAMNFIVSKNAISKYEKGQMMPDSKVLIALANALDVKTDFFFRQSQVNIPEVKFRKHSKLGQREIDRLKSTSTDILERYLEIESMLEFENKFKNPIANYLCSTEEDAREVAMKLRKSWKLGMNPIPNVIEMLESREVKIIEFEAPQEFDGLSTWVGDIPLIVLNKSFDELRKRFTTLHELGHLVLKIDRNKISAKSEEKLCNSFASELLLPAEKLFENLGRHRQNISLNELIDLKEYYGVSLAAIVYKIQEFNILPQSKVKKFWQSRNQDPELKLEKAPKYGLYEGKEESDRFMQLIFRAASEEIISLSKAAALANMKLADFRDQYLAI